MTEAVQRDGAETSQELVSIVELKELAKKMLPPNSTVRELILSEPDYLSSMEVRIKVKMYSRLLYREMKGEFYKSARTL